MFTLAEPKNRFGRFGQVVATVWTICVLMGSIHLLVNGVFELEVREWSIWIRLSIFFVVSVLAFLFEMTTFGDDDEDDRAGLPNVAPTRASANARFHERDSKA